MFNLFETFSYGDLMDLAKSLLTDGKTPLNKALDATTTSSMTDLSNLTGGRAITIENIDTDLKSTVAEEKQLRFWTLLRHSKIYAVLDQWMKLSSHGEAGGRHSAGVFTSESAFPKAKDVTLSRQVDTTKFLRDLRNITHVMENVSTYTDKDRIVNKAGAMTILNANEMATIFGDSSVIPNEFDGLLKKIDDARVAGYDVVVDCRNTGSASGSKGGSISEGAMDEAARKISEALGAATHLIMPSIMQADINAILPVSRRVNMGGVPAQSMKDMMLGMPAVGFMSSFAYNGWGDGTVPHFKFVPHIDKYYPSGESTKVKAPSTAREVTSGDAPAAPTSIALALADDASTKFSNPGDLGEYYYKVSSLNADGESAAVAALTSVTVTAGKKVKLTIAANDADITGFAVYRSAMDASDSSDCRWIGDYAVDNPTGNTVIYDLNENLPGTSTAILISNAPETDALDYRQLLPFIRIPLPFATQGAIAQPYLYLLYHYLRVQKMANQQTGYGYHMVFKNIRWSGSAF